MITVRARGVGATIAHMKKRKNRLKNTTAANKSAAILMLQWVQRNFDAEGGMHDGGALRWPQLAPSTIRRRRKGRGSGSPKILQDTGDLFRRWDIRATRQKGILKSRQGYSGKHERGEGNVPMRKIFPVNKQAQEIVFPVYQRHVKVAIR